MKKYITTLDYIEQPFDFNEEVIKNLLNKENDGIIRCNNLILIRSNIEKNFKHCFTVNLINDKKIETLGYLYWGSCNIYRSSIYFKIFNERFYKKELSLDLVAISETLGLTISRLPNIDIAVDFNFNVIDIIYDLFQSKDFEVIILNKLRKKHEFISELDNHGRGTLLSPYEYKGFNLTSKDKVHKFQLVAYDKGLEIERSSQKHYIRDAEGFQDIYRLEVRASRHELEKTLNALKINLNEFITRVINNSNELYRVWQHLINRLIRFRRRGARKCEDIIQLLRDIPHQSAIGLRAFSSS